MPLTACRDCEHQVSPQAPTCPNCGVPWPGRRNGWGYEWKSQATVLGWPLVHIAFGRDANRRLRVARGIVAIGQFAIGLVTFAQFGIGLLFGLGQFMAGSVVVAQFAAGLLFGLGQFATGWMAIGQFAVGCKVVAQIGWSLAGRW